MAWREILRAAHHDQAQRRAQRHRHHVGIDESTHADAGVESVSREVHALRLRRNLDFDLGIAIREGSEQRLEQHGNHRRWDRQPQHSPGALSELACGLTGGHEFLEGRAGARQETFAGLCETDAARGAREQRSSEARFERAYRLADGRGSHAELGRRAAEIAVLRDFQERLHAVERAFAHREVLLHGVCTSWWIVIRAARSYK
jgi:hypothetical protein